MATRVCSCCGHPLAADGVEAKLTMMQKRIYEALIRAGTAGLTRPELMDRVYALDPSGGPNCMNVLNVQKTAMKPILARFGLEITSTRGHDARWRLRPLTPLPRSGTHESLERVL